MSAQTSHHRLAISSAVFWYAGCIALFLKGGALLIDAWQLRPDPIWPQLATGGALLVGSLKAKLFFSRFCRKNLMRIETLKQPKPWQFFRPGFFGMLFLMILVGGLLSRLAQHSYPALILVAMLDLSIASALAFSGSVHWTFRVSGA